MFVLWEKIKKYYKQNRISPLDVFSPTCPFCFVISFKI